MDEIIIRYLTTAGLEREERIPTDEDDIDLELREMISVDLLPLIWCSRLESISLRHNRLEEIDLYPLSRCRRLRSLSLNSNQLATVNLTPLGECMGLEELHLEHNRIRKVDLSPLFQCPRLVELGIDDTVALTADIYLRSIGSWPEVLLDRYHRILWTHE